MQSEQGTTCVRHEMLAAIARKLHHAGKDSNQPSALMLADMSAVQIAHHSGLEPSAVSAAVAESLGIDKISNLESHHPSAEFMEKIPIGFARQHGILGLASDNGVLPVAISNPGNLEQLDILSRFLGKAIKPLFAEPDALLSAINAAYQKRTGQTQSLIESVDKDSVLNEIADIHKHDDLLDVASRAPVIKLVNLILFEAVKLQASDVHIQPYEEKLVIRMRIDGVLFDIYTLKRGLQEEIVSRVKVMGKMNIAEKRLPQDGRATVQVGDRTIDLRIASLPASHGERVVIRLLDKSARLYTLSELGMHDSTRDKFKNLIESEHGILLVTGPTGSGKSSTLYAALQDVNSTEKNILTLEDPIEYQLPGISQTQINEKKGMTFASGLRNVLRQDPDIIMVGEIRDHDTAVMAIQSSLTGHLVFSTLHTNDAASAVTRLLDLGIESYLVASSVSAVLAQRLVRRICNNCAEPYTPNAEELEQLGLTNSNLDFSKMRKGRGCDECRNMGYKGRVGIFELLVMTDEIRQLTQNCATAGKIKSTAIANNMETLADDGRAKVLEGITTIDEVLRVTMGAAF